MTDINSSYLRADSAGRASFEAMDNWTQSNLLSGSEPALSPALGVKMNNSTSFDQFDVVGELGNVPGAGLAMATAAAVAASRTVGAGNAALTFTAVTPGAAGNDISIIILASAGAADVSVDGHEITITPLTGSATATQVAALINADEAASLLVSVAAGGTGGSNVATQTEVQLQNGADKIQAIGVMAHGATLGASGALNGNVWFTGCFNPDALGWDASFDTDAKKEAAFRGATNPTNIICRQRTA